ncbi:Protein of unknown function [Cryobacterium flavum]|uniref:DUF3105 domain-containing protein n=1 Tax=Cryobacterium flavum TaxID=1424659 RepID=A0A4R8UYC1_9MICO|nr:MULTISPECIES: DUF3105 domain-containing protein [Cryobacterium]TFB73865.1 DUF3105 domain-containing protein [Cryobacterium flavum]SDN42751.1 Protein of unknown function [Cryobacterium flavum]
MTPQPGSPVNQASLKQERAAKRTKKLEEYHRQQKRGKRNRLIGIVGGAVAVVAIIALIVTAFVLTPKAANYAGGGAGDASTIEGVETFTNTAGHVETAVTYEQTPPAGGEHASAWLNCGVYDQVVPNENAVHSLEHGAIWVTYDPSISDAELATLKAELPSTYVVLSPFEGIPAPIVLSGWNAQLQVDSAGDARIADFFSEFWKSVNVPEDGAPCSGAIDAPGKVS